MDVGSSVSGAEVGGGRRGRQMSDTPMADVAEEEKAFGSLFVEKWSEW